MTDEEIKLQILSMVIPHTETVASAIKSSQRFYDFVQHYKASDTFSENKTPE